MTALTDDTTQPVAVDDLPEMPDQTEQPPRRLRVAHVIVQPVLVWDDGTELSPGPVTEPVQQTLTELGQLAARMPAELARLEALHHDQ